MINLTAKELCLAVKGRFLQKGDKGKFKGVSIDSRDKSLRGKVFFALQGKKFDGHDFLPEVLKKNVGALVVHRSFLSHSQRGKRKTIPLPVIIEVEDTLKSLGHLASYWREKIHLKVIGITGSMGKTTTKHLCLQLMKSDFSVMASPNSFNNVYGVSLSILSVNEKTDFLIQEIGMNQKGEIKPLCQIARPQIVIVTKIGSAHIGNLGSEDNIAKEKEHIYWNLPKDAVAVFNRDDPYTQIMYDNWKDKVQKSLCFSSQNKKVDIFLKVDKVSAQSFTVSGHFQGLEGRACLDMTGSAHLANVMSAVTLALASGVKPARLWERLPSCSLPSGRSQWITLSCGAQALFDAYNASPESVTALLTHFLSPIVKGRKILILGDFLELNSHLPAFQKQWIQILVNSSVELLWFIGEQAETFGALLKESGFKAKLYLSKDTDPLLAKEIRDQLDDSSVLAFKASRKIHLEKILAYFKPLMNNNELFTC